MRRSLVATALLLATCGKEPVELGPPSVIVLVMDGVRSEESFGNERSSATGDYPSEDLMIGSWNLLVPQAARAVNAWNLGATITAPAHCTMASGRRQPLANYAPNEGPGLYVPELPGLVQAMREQGVEQDQIRFIGNTEHLAPLPSTLWPGMEDLQGTYDFVGEAGSIIEPASKDAEVIQAVMGAMREHDVRFVMANLHRVDRAGHWGAEHDYPDAVKEIDNQLPTFWKFVQDQEAYAGNTWVIIVSDHGRHQEFDTDPPPWRHHGDSCTGCRHIPLLVLGPGVREGEMIETSITQADLAPTIAALLGVRVPWAEGRVLHELFEHPLLGPTRSGVADRVVSGDHVAELVYLDDTEHRAALYLDGEVVSDPDALSVEEPTMVFSGTDGWVCWREVQVSLDADASPWITRCLETDDDGASWTDIGSPEDIAGPYWEATLLPSPDGVVLAYPDNPNAITTPGLDGDEVGVVLSTWNGTEWVRSEAEEDVSFPTDPTVLTVDGELFVVAVGAGMPGDDSRHTRQVFVWRAYRQDGGGFDFAAGSEVLLSELSPGERWRLEYPALRYDEASATFHLAAVGYSEGYTAIVTARSTDTVAWTDEATVDVSGSPVPHLAPVWVDDGLVFAVVGDDRQVSVCGWSGDTQCAPLGSERVSSYVVDGSDVAAVVDVGEGEWEVTRVPITDLGL